MKEKKENKKDSQYKLNKAMAIAIGLIHILSFLECIPRELYIFDN